MNSEYNYRLSEGESKDASNGHHNGHTPTPRETAPKLRQQELDILQFARDAKGPNERQWEQKPSLPLDAVCDELNIGVHLRRRLTDADLDTIEAVRAAAFYFPPTGMQWGRESKPNSHRMYVLEDGESIPKGKSKYQDPTPRVNTNADESKKGMLLEIRTGQGKQTLAPGSLHPSGQIVRFELNGDGKPSLVKLAVLLYAAGHTSAAALVARYWNEGVRHDMALPLAGLLYHGGMSRADAQTFLRAVCAAAGDDDVENRLRVVEDTYDHGSQGAHVTGGPTLTLEDYLTEAQVKRLRIWLDLKAQTQQGFVGPDGYPLSADGDGDRFAAMWTGRALYCAVENAWYLWDGKRWARDELGDVREWAKQTVYAFRRLVGEHARDPLYGVWAKYAATRGGVDAINNMLISAGSKQDMRVHPNTFEEGNRRYLNVENGTLEFDRSTGKVTSHLHDPADRLTALAPVFYDPNATHPLLDQCHRRFYPETKRWDFLMEHAAYVMPGTQKRHSLQLIGPHDAGKSTTLNLMRAMLGPDYAMTLRSDNLIRNPHKGGDTPRADLWRVRNARLVTVAEMEPGARFDVALYKAITGQDAIGVRNLFDVKGGQDVEFTFALWMSGNKPYGPPPEEQAAFDRLHVLACDHVVPEHERIPEEEIALTTDPGVRAALLAEIVRAFARLCALPGKSPMEIEAAREAKAQLQDDLDDWTSVIEEVFVVTRDAHDGVKKSEAWEWVRNTLEMEGSPIRNPRKLQQKFEEALAWRVGAPTHSDARFGNAKYWPGLKWSEGVLARVGPKPSKPDW